ncbi:hypothetical protein CHS0354_028442, partial [Potamilus streckersoni]
FHSNEPTRENARSFIIFLLSSERTPAGVCNLEHTKDFLGETLRRHNTDEVMRKHNSYCFDFLLSKALVFVTLYLTLPWRSLGQGTSGVPGITGLTQDPTTGQPLVPVCNFTIDLIFVLDASVSIRDADFEAIRYFTVRTIAQLPFITGRARVGVIFYGEAVYPDSQLIHLGDITDQNDLIRRILSIQRDPLNFNTNTAEALRRMKKMFIDKHRAGALQVGIVVTDGDSMNFLDTIRIASEVKTSGIRMLAVGVKNEIGRELQLIASFPNLAIGVNTDGLQSVSFGRRVASLVCNLTSDGTIETVKLPPVKVDMVFLLDESQYVTQADYDTSRYFLKSILSRYYIDVNLTRVGVINFATDTHLFPSYYIALGSKNSDADLMVAIDGLRKNFFNINRNIGVGLRVMISEFNSGNDFRPMIGVLIISGQSEDEIYNTVLSAKAAGINLVVIQLWSGQSQWEQSNIASSLAKFFKFEDYASLKSQDNINNVNTVLHAIASGTFTTNTSNGTGVSGAVWQNVADIVFMIDGSQSVMLAPDFLMMKYLMKKIIERFRVGREYARFAVLIFDGRQVYREIAFDFYSDAAALVSLIDGMALYGTTAAADASIALARMGAMFQANGRASAAWVGILLAKTNAGDYLLATAEARRAKEAGIALITLGLDIDIQGSLYAFLASLATSVGGRSATYAVVTKHIEVNLETISLSLHSFAEGGGAPYLGVKWNRTFDFIVLIHDASGSNSAEVKVFLMTLFRSFLIGSGNAQVGVIVFGRQLDLQNMIVLGEIDTNVALERAVDNLRIVQSDGVDMAAAFQRMQTMFKDNGRPSIPRIALLLTSGNPNNLALASIEAQKAVEMGIAMIVYGIGGNIDVDVMSSIALNRTYVFRAGAWESLMYNIRLEVALMGLTFNQLVYDSVIPPENISNRCVNSADVIFLLDASDSITPENFETLKYFIALMIKGMEISPVFIRVGIIPYGTQPLEESIIPLKSYNVDILLYRMLKSIKQNSALAITETAAAIRRMREMFADSTRDGVVQIGITITDGLSYNPSVTKDEAKAAHDSGIQMIAVGVGDRTFQDELQEIATQKDAVFNFNISNFKDVNSVVQVLNLVCQWSKVSANIASVASGNCDKNMDIIFVMDASTSIPEKDFDHLKRFIKSMIDSFEVGLDKTRIGIVPFSVDVMYNNIANLTASLLPQILIAKLNNIEQPLFGTGTQTGAAIAVMFEMFQLEARRHIPRIGVVITDGKSDNPTETVDVARRVKDAGIYMLTIGIGQRVFEDELFDIASEPDAVIVVDNFVSLTSVEPVLSVICPDDNEPKPSSAERCARKMDLVLLIDASDSMDAINFQKVKTFIKRLVQRLDISDTKTRIGVVTFASEVKANGVINLQESLINLTLKIEQRINKYSLDFGTATNLGLKRVNDMFTEQGRSGVPGGILYITDGKSDNSTLTNTEAKWIRDAEIRTIALGVGSIFTGTAELAELQDIATEPGLALVLNDFNEFENLDFFVKKICSAPSSATDQCNIPMDIALIVDTSDSIKAQDFRKVKQFVQDLVLSFKIGLAETRIAVIPFASYVNDVQVIELRSSLVSGYLSGLIEAKLYQDLLNVGTNTSEGISRMRDVFRKEDRPGVPKIGIVLTDGVSEDTVMTKNQSTIAQQEGIRMISIGVGASVNRNELLGIASAPDLVINLDSFDVFANTAFFKEKICTEQCDVNLDIGIIVDTSDSIAANDFTRMKQFVQDIIHSFYISESKTRVAVVPYGTYVDDTVVITLQSSLFVEYLESVVAIRLQQNPQNFGTNTAAAIAKTREIFQQEGRQNVQKVGILLTDGVSDDQEKTKEQSNLARTEGIRMIVVGVGNRVQKTELDTIAFAPEYSISLTDFGKFEDAIFFKDRICTVTEQCLHNLDIVFVIDASASITSSDFVRLKTFVKELISRFSLSQNESRIGFVVFGTDVKSDQVLSFSTDKIQLRDATDSRVYQDVKNPGSAIYKGIERMTNLFEVDGRTNALKLSVVFTDGKSDNAAQTAVEAQKARSKDIRMITVGIGNQTDIKELSSIASGEQLLTLDNFGQLLQNAAQLQNIMCRDVCSREYDLIFLIDTLDGTNLQKLKLYIVQVAQGFNVGVNSTRIAVQHVQNIPNSWTGLSLGETLSLQALSDRLQAINVIGSSQMSLITALTFVTNMIQRDGRTEVPKAVVLISDSLLQNSASAVEPLASNLKDNLMTKIIIVNTAKDVVSEWRAIANGNSLLRELGGSYDTLPEEKSLYKVICKEQCDIDMDIGVIVDTSDSISDNDFKRMKQFVQDLLHSFDIGQSKTRVAVVPYGTYVDDAVVITLQSSLFVEYLDSVVESRLKQNPLNFGTNTAAAIEKTRKIFQQDGRRNVPKVGILLTDGVSDDQERTKEESNIARTEGIRMIVVGVGNRVQKTELDTIAFAPEYSISLADFGKFEDAIFFKDRICTVIEQCLLSLDIVFVIDASASITSSDFTRLKTLVKELIGRFSLSQNESRIGFVVFGTDVKSDQVLSFSTDKIQLRDATDILVYQDVKNPGSAIYKGIEKMTNLFEVDGRTNTLKLSVVFTDGKSDNAAQTAIEAQKARSKDIRMITVGIGNQTDIKELSSIASGEQLLTLDNFGQLLQDAAQLQNIMCRDVCSREYDLIFLIDCLDETNLQKLKLYIVQVAQGFNVGVNSTRIAVQHVQNIPNSWTGLSLGETLSLQTLSDRLQATNVIGSSQMSLTTAFMFVTNMIQREGRPEVPKAVVLISDSLLQNSASAVEPLASNLKDNLMTKIIIVNTAKEVTSVWRAIANSNSLLRELGGSYDTLPDEQSLYKIICKEQCDIDMDIGVIVDTSDSISDNDFKRMKQFVQDLIHSFDIGQSKTRVAVVPYGTYVDNAVVITLQSSLFVEYLDSVIESRLLQNPLNFGTNTAAAIEKTRDIFQQEGRRNVPKVGILLTDGVSDDQERTKEESNIARTEGIRMIVVGVGNRVQKTELDTIAFAPEYSISLRDFGKFEDAIFFKDRICTVIEQCLLSLDIVFVIDASASITSSDFTRLKTFVKELINRFSLSQNESRIGFVVFGTDVKSDQVLSFSTDKLQLRDATDSRVYQDVKNPGSAIYKGIERMTNMFEVDGRTNALKLSVVFTDGKSDNAAQTAIEAQKARSKDIRMITVGIGNQTDIKELSSIASGEQLLTLDNFGQLLQDAAQLQNIICRDVCSREYDLIFLIDTLDGNNLQKLKLYIVQVAQGFNVGVNSTRIAVQHVQNIPNSWTGLSLGETLSLQALSDRLQTINVIGSSQTSLTTAFTFITNMIQREGRTEVPKTVVLISDSLLQNSASMVEPLASNLKDNLMTKIIIVNTAKDVVSEWRAIANSNSLLRELGGSYDILPDEQSLYKIICKAEEKQCDIDMDIGVIVDTSDSISDNDFKRMKQFVQDLIHSFDIGQSKTRVAVVPYGTYVDDTVVITLQSSLFVEYLDSVIESRLLQNPLNFGTNTAAAIAKTREIFQQEGRRYVPKVGILLTDGVSDDQEQTKEESNIARTEGIRMIVVGVGNRVQKTELDTIAFAPEYSISLADFGKFEDAIFFKDRICTVIEQCLLSLDIVFVIDASASITSSDFTRLKTFVKELINRFSLSQNESRIGFVVFGTDVKSDQVLSFSMDKTQLRDATDIRVYQDVKNPGSAIYKGIERMTNLFDVDGRTNALKLSVVFTDGKSDNAAQTAIEAQKARAKDIRMITVGIGNQTDIKELSSIASGEQLLTLDNFGQLLQDAAQLQNIMCRDVCSREYDLIFLIDTLDGTNLQKLKLYIVQVAQGFNVGVNSTRVAVQHVQNIPNSWTGLSLGDTLSLQTLSDRLQAINVIGSSQTSLTTAFTFVTNMIQRDGRPEVPKTVVLISDSLLQNSASMVEPLASNLKDNFMTKIIIVNTAKDVVTEWRAIANGNSLLRELGGSYDTLPDEQSLYKVICKEQCDIDMDIGVIVDTSDSISDNDFKRMKQFVQDLIHSFDIGQSKTRVAVVPYGTYVDDAVVITLQSSLFVEYLDSVIESRLQQNPLNFGTNTAAAIAKTREIFQQEGKLNVPKVGILLTDGVSDDQERTKEESNLARTEGIRMIVVGVGNRVQKTELDTIAFAPEYSISLTDFGKFEDAIFFKDRICTVTEQCLLGFDIVFVIDASASITSSDFTRLKTFVKELINRFSLSQNESRIGFVVFGTDVKNDQVLSFSTDKIQLRDATDSRIYQDVKNPGSAIYKGIERMTNLFEVDGRTNALKLSVVFTDGKSDNAAQTAIEAQEARAKDIRMITVGIGNQTDIKELSSIASGEQLLTLDNFGQLLQKITPLENIICRDVCSREYDLIFLIDILDGTNLQKLKFYIVQVAQGFNVGINSTRVAVQHVQNIPNSWTGLSLGDTLSLQALSDRLQATNVIGSSQTSLTTAFTFVTNMIQRDSRPEVPKAVVLISDLLLQNSASAVKPLASNLKDNLMTKIIIVNTAQDVVSEWAAIASSKSLLRELGGSYDTLPDEQSLYTIICKAEEKQCDIDMDIGVIVDTSDSINENDFKRMKQFVHDLIHSFDIGQSKTRVAVVPYGTYVDDAVVITLQSSLFVEYLDSVVAIRLQQNPLNFGTNTAAAIAKTREIFQQEGRLNVPKVGILLTDGVSDDQEWTKEESNIARTEGIRMIVVGVGNRVQKTELDTIAFAPEYSIDLMDFDKLKDTNIFKDRICSVIEICAETFDIIFLVDTKNLTLIKISVLYLEKIAQSFNIGPDTTRVGVIHVQSLPAQWSGLQLKDTRNFTYLARLLGEGLHSAATKDNSLVTGLQAARNMFDPRPSGGFLRNTVRTLVVLSDRFLVNTLDVENEVNALKVSLLKNVIVVDMANSNPFLWRSIASPGQAYGKAKLDPSEISSMQDTLCNLSAKDVCSREVDVLYVLDVINMTRSPLTVAEIKLILTDISKSFGPGTRFGLLTSKTNITQGPVFCNSFNPNSVDAALGISSPTIGLPVLRLAIQKARTAIKNERRVNVQPVVVLITDEVQLNSAEIESEFLEANSNNIYFVIYTPWQTTYFQQITFPPQQIFDNRRSLDLRNPGAVGAAVCKATAAQIQIATTTVVTTTVKNIERCSRDFDVIFMIDTNTAAPVPGIQLYIEQVAESFSIGAGKTRVGLTSVRSMLVEWIRLENTTDFTNLSSDLRKTYPFQPKQASLATGFAYAMNIFTRAARDFPRNVMLFTNRQATDVANDLLNIQNEVNRLMSEYRAKVVVLDLENPDVSVWNTIASPGQIYGQSTLALSDVSHMRKVICDLTMTKCSKNLDIVFVLDVLDKTVPTLTASSVKTLLTAITKSFNTSSRFGIVTADTNVQLPILSNQFDSKAVDVALGTGSPVITLPDIRIAIQKALQVIRSGNRYGIPAVVVLVTDSIFLKQPDVQSAITAASQAGISFVVYIPTQQLEFASNIIPSKQIFDQRNISMSLPNAMSDAICTASPVIATTTTTHTTTIPTDGKCTSNSDVVFLMDTTDNPTILRVEAFIVNAIKNLSVSATSTRVAVYNVRTLPQDWRGLNLNAVQDYNTFVRLMQQPLPTSTPGAQGTLLTGLRKLQAIFSSQSRPNIPQTAVIITNVFLDFLEVFEINTVADDLKASMGVNIIVINIGSQDNRDFVNIASPNNIYGSTNTLPDVRTIGNVICAFSSSLVTPTTPSTITTPSPTSCKENVDICFVVEIPIDKLVVHIDPLSFFVSNLAKTFPVSTMFGVVDSDPLVLALTPFPLEPFNVVSSLIDLAPGVVDRDLPVAIRVGRELLVAQKRSSSKAIMVIITENSLVNSPGVSAEISLAQQANIKLAFITFGQNVQPVPLIPVDQVFAPGNIGTFPGVNEVSIKICSMAFSMCENTLAVAFVLEPSVPLPNTQILATEAFVKNILKSFKPPSKVGSVNSIKSTDLKDAVDLTAIDFSVPGGTVPSSDLQLAIRKMRTVINAATGNDTKKVGVIMTDLSFNSKDIRLQLNLTAQEKISVVIISADRTVPYVGISQSQIIEISSFVELPSIQNLEQTICTAQVGNPVGECDPGTQSYRTMNGDCRRYVITYCDGREEIKTCDFGLYFDESRISCRLAKDAHCRYDPCMMYTYDHGIMALPGSCNGYMKCFSNYTKYVQCCYNKNMRYISGIGCVIDNSCTQPCPPVYPDVTTQLQRAQCFKRPVTNELNKYDEIVNVVSMETTRKTCPGNQIYQPRICSCENSTTSTPTKDCKPLIDWNFNSGAPLFNPGELEIKNVRFANGSAEFVGNSYIKINSLSSVDFVNTIVIDLSFKSVSGGGLVDLVLLSNCLGKSVDDSSVSIKLSPFLKNLTMKVAGKRHVESLQFSFQDFVWTKISIIYDGMNLIGFMKDEKMLRGEEKGRSWLSGDIIQRADGIVIGAGCGLGGYEGYVDNVSRVK